MRLVRFNGLLAAILGRQAVAASAVWLFLGLAASSGRAQIIQTDVSSLTVKEGEYATLKVRLSRAPAAPVQVTVNIVSGDADLATATVVGFDTIVGPVEVALFDKQTPLTVANFLNYVTRGDYSDTFIHRAVPGFVVQGGGYRWDGSAAVHIATDPAVTNEPVRSNVRGTIAMAKVAGDPNSATSEWFFNIADNNDPNDPGSLDNQNGGFTAFGEVLDSGMDVIDEIASLNRYVVQDPELTEVPLIEEQDGSLYFVWLNSVTVLSAPTLTFTPANWSTWQTVTLTALQDDDITDGTATARCSGSGLTARDVILHENDEDTVTILPGADTIEAIEGRTTTFDVRLSHQPTTSYTVTASRVSGDTDITVQGGASLTFTPSNWDTPQQVTLAAAADTDEQVGTATIRLQATGLATRDVTVNEVETTYRIIVETTQVTALQGSIQTFSVSLNTRPVEPLTVHFTKTGGDDDLRTVTVVRFRTVLGDILVGLYDHATPLTVANFLNYVNDGDYSNTFFHRLVTDSISIAQGGSFTWEDATGDSDVPADPPVTNEPVRSNVRGTIAMAKVAGDPHSATSGWFFNLADNSAELDFQNGGFTAFGEVLGDGMTVLDAIGALPTVDLDGAYTDLPLRDWDNDPTHVYGYNLIIVGTVEVTAPDLVFTPEDWEDLHLAAVTALPDADLADGTASFQLSAEGLSPVAVTVNEDDPDVVAILPDTDAVTVVEGGTGSFGVRLSHQPEAPVTVTVSRFTGDSDITVQDGASLVFTPQDWDTQQTVTLAAAPDADTDAGTASIRLQAAGLATQVVAATEEDTTYRVVMETPQVVVPEGGANTFGVRLSMAPPAPVTVAVEFFAGDPDITIPARADVEFTSGNWDSFQQVTVSAAEDDDAAPGEAIIRGTGPGSLYRGEITAVEQDNDVLTIVPAVAELTVPEGTIGTLEVQLSAKPLEPVTVHLGRQSGDSDLKTVTVVYFRTVLGDIPVALFDDDTPLTVANFLKYVTDGDYTNTFFHRLVTEGISIAQGGSYTWGTDGDAAIPVDPPVANEPGRSNIRGTIAMAKLPDDPDSATSGWFFNLADNSADLDPQNGGFTAFGGVLGDGMTVLDSIAALPTADLGGAYADLPLRDWDGDPNSVFGENLVIVTTIDLTAPDLVFTPEDWNVPHLAAITARPDADAADGAATFRLEADDLPPVDITVTEQDPEVLSILTDRNAVTVPEGQAAGLYVRLSNQPLTTLQLQLSMLGPDPDLTADGDGTLEFTPQSWQDPVLVTLRAAEDNGDTDNGTSTLRIAPAGRDDAVAAHDVTLNEQDDDVVLDITHAGAGTTIPAGPQLVDTNDDPALAVEAVPDGGQTLAEWRSSVDGILSHPRASSITVSPAQDATITARFTVDADGDQLPDQWEAAAGVDLDPDDDDDGDGSNNRDEFLDGTDPLRYLLQLGIGWNLIGIAGVPADNTVAGIFATPSRDGDLLVHGSVWGWHADRYMTHDALKQTRGYWAWAGATVSVELTAPPPAGGAQLQLRAGWNLISIPHRPVDNSLAALFDGHVLGPAWTWSGRRLQPTETVVPLRAYWVYAPADATVTLP